MSSSSFMSIACLLPSHPPPPSSSSSIHASFRSIATRPPLPLHHLFCSLPARDSLLDFGKYRGCLLGTAPSRYLRWMARDMRRGRLSYWADYADEVLQDPYYQQRLEWEKAERLLKRELTSSMILLGDPEAVSVLKALGWDVEDRAAWNDVNISLLGTTRGGMIPRLKAVEQEGHNPGERSGKILQRIPGVKKVAERLKASLDIEASQSEPLSLREELRRRRQRRDEQLLAEMSKKSPGKSPKEVFPGREGLLKKVMKNRGL